jgi:hypothetical protein
MRRAFLAVALSTLVLAGCTGASTDAATGVPVDPSLRLIQRGLERRYYSRFVRVTRVEGDTLIVRFEGGMDLLSGGPGRGAAFGAVARLVAREAVVLADGLLDSCSTVTVANVRPRRFGGFDFGMRETRASFPANELLKGGVPRTPCRPPESADSRTS